MLLFASDIDNTIIYSHKKDINTPKVPCELYEGSNISFITKNTQEKLDYIYSKCLFLPVTTRSIEQYKRIQFSHWQPKYAITSNGGNLLINGSPLKEWNDYFIETGKNARYALEKAETLLENHPYRILDIKLVDNLFVYTKSSQPEETIKMLKNNLQNEPVKVYTNFSKIYVVPENLNKGTALKKFINDFAPDINKVISAGDSIFDIPLLEAAAYAIFPEKLPYTHKSENYYKIAQEEIFSEKVVENVLKLI